MAINVSESSNHSTWCTVEQKVKFNDPSSSNGQLKVWVNGNVVYNKTNIRFRIVSARF